MTVSEARRPVPSAARIEGFAPIESYAALGDGRTVALVALDGSVDWLAVPDLAGPTVFGALLDPGRGGSFELEPVDRYAVERRYLPRSNVLETTYSTSSGVAVVTDALTLQDGGQLSWTELVRRVEARAGSVRFRYAATPRLDFGAAAVRLERRREAIVASGGECVLAFLAWDAGAPAVAGDSIRGELEAREGVVPLLVCIGLEQDPIPVPPRSEIEVRLERTVDAWRRWLGFHAYQGPWEPAVERSALALKLLIDARTGAIAAAPTTSLPERIGGDRNYDYRFAWVRDTSFTLDALGALGYREQVHASLAWLLEATAPTHPELKPLYTLGGGEPERERELDLRGYRDSRPVRRGNRAFRQRQLGSYGALLETIELYVRHGNVLDEGTRRRVAETADRVCELWRVPDSGIWELDDERHFTVSKAQCWTALDRAVALAAEGEVAGAHAARWRSEREAVRTWVHEHCWSERMRSYALHDGTDALDAALLLAVRSGFLGPEDERAHATVDAIRRELGAGGPLLYRYRGQAREEGAFLACSFWLVEALARIGRVDEACATMEEALGLANDVGLYAEEIDPSTLAHLGNFPQGLTHLSLVTAATAVAAALRQ